MKNRLWHLLVVGWLATAVSGAVLAGPEFSAEVLRYGPEGKQAASGKLFVGDKRGRVEDSHQGQHIIRIIDENRGLEWILFPDRREYGEQKLGGPGGKPPGMGIKPTENPCAGRPGMTCRRLGEEKIAGRPAVKWELTASHQGQTMKSTQWLDKERGIPLRQEMPGGHKTELRFVARENLNGRRVEKWEMVATMPDRREMRTFQWIDPELALTVRQEFPGGMVSELKNIQIGKQPDDLFKIPAGFKRVTAPPGPPKGPRGGPTGH
ncbi:MAG: hypothetical protein LGR52_04365 [Candidatus Thiosymbion ectosymbiont of Robbea hypermnestra]|nr:hypothetical protein [Candidatus Thiosymbion ectosymbiont of Robbea hypermnestra]